MFEEQTISTDQIYNGKTISLRVDTVETKNKGYQKREIVEHKGAVGILAINEKNEVILIKQFRKTVEKHLWEIPAGKIEQGENPKDAAIRELKEETGYVAKNVKLINKFYTSPGFSNQKVYLYLATDLEKTDEEFESMKYIETHLIDFNEALEMVFENVIQDAKTSIAILISKQFL